MPASSRQSRGATGGGLPHPLFALVLIRRSELIFCIQFIATATAKSSPPSASSTAAAASQAACAAPAFHAAAGAVVRGLPGWGNGRGTVRAPAAAAAPSAERGRGWSGGRGGRGGREPWCPLPAAAATPPGGRPGGWGCRRRAGPGIPSSCRPAIATATTCLCTRVPVVRPRLECRRQSIPQHLMASKERHVLGGEPLAAQRCAQGS